MRGTRASMASAAARQRSSRKRGPMICTPTGKPFAMPVGTAIAGSPSTGIAIIVADWRQTSIVRSALSTSNPCAYGNSVHTGASTSGVRARNSVPVADQPRALGKRLQVGIDAAVRDVVRHEPHRRANAVVAIALEVGLHEAAEFGNEHLEPQLKGARRSPASSSSTIS